MCFNFRMLRLLLSHFSIRCRSRTLSLLVRHEREFVAALKDYSSVSRPRLTFGHHGHNAGSFQDPKGIAVGETFLYVTEATMNRVNVFTLDGKHHNTITNKSDMFICHGEETLPHLCSPFDVSIYEPLKEVCITNRTSGKVSIFSENGQFIRDFTCRHRDSERFISLSGIAVHRNGTIVCVDTATCQISLFDYHGNFINEFGEDGDGDGQFGLPEYVAVDSRNNSIVVSDTINCRIQVFSMDGTFLFKQGGPGTAWGRFEFPSGVAVDSYGNIIVCDRGLHRIQVFDRHGKFVHKFGLLGSAPGMFENPRGIGVSNSENIAVVDNENNRVQVF